MPARLTIMTIFFGYIIPFSGGDKIDEMLPLVLKRLEEVRQVMLPVSTSVLEELVFLTGTYYIPIDSKTELCRQHSSILFDSFINSDIWALKMVDASSKMPSGMMDGNIMDLGNYGQCVGVEVPFNMFRGQHCIIETKGLMPPEFDDLNPKKPVLPFLRMDLMFSVCVPSSCTAADVKNHMDITLESINATAIVYNSSCSSVTPLTFQKKDFVAMVVVVVIIVLVALSTYYENVTQKFEQKPILVCFSLNKSHQLLTSPRTADCLTCLHGLRVLTLTWVILGNRLLHLIMSPNLRLKDYTENIDKLTWAPMQNVHLAVEIFFLISGILVCYNFLKDRHNQKKFSYFNLCIRRYLRLTPQYAILILLYATVFVYITDGPIWRRFFEFNREFCQKNWWLNLLYISNYVNQFEYCMPHTWYLSADFQLYILSPLLLIPLNKSRKLGMLVLSISLLATLSLSVLNAYVLKLPAVAGLRTDRSEEEHIFLDYIQTHSRAASFLIGIGVGYLYFRIRQKQLIVKLSKSKLWMGWTVAVTFILIVLLSPSVFLNDGYVYTAWLDTACHVLYRPIISMAVAWVIFVCVIGYGGIVNTVLSWNIFVPLSRLSYCAFLIHFVVQDVQSYSTRTAVTVESPSTVYVFFADLVISYVLATFLYLAIEAPISSVMSCLFHEQEQSKAESEIPMLLTCRRQLDSQYVQGAINWD